MHIGDTAFLNNSYIVFTGFNTQVNDTRYHRENGDIAVAAQLSMYDEHNKLSGQLNPVYYIRQQFEYQVDDTLRSPETFVHFSRILPKENAAEIKIKQASGSGDYVTMKALVFPYINVLWFGVMVMVLGFLISIRKRIMK